VISHTFAISITLVVVLIVDRYVPWTDVDGTISPLMQLFINVCEATAIVWLTRQR